MLIVPTTPDMLNEVSRRIALGDREEFNKLQGGRDLQVTLMTSLGETSRTLVHNGRILATGGSNECLWFVTTRWCEELTPRERVQMVLALRGHLEEVRKVLPPELMTNFVYEHNTAHRRLLDALGARYGSYTELSPAGHPFRQFWL